MLALFVDTFTRCVTGDRALGCRSPSVTLILMALPSASSPSSGGLVVSNTGHHQLRSRIQVLRPRRDQREKKIQTY
jgi:hypothetical protein